MCRISVREGVEQMILFVGSEDRGFFLQEPAKLKKMELDFVPGSLSIEHQLTEILKRQMDYLVIDIDQYVDPAEELATKIESVKRAKNCDVVIYAPGYDRRSRVIQELEKHGIRYYIFSANQAEAREAFERCMNGYYLEPEAAEEPEEAGDTAVKDPAGKRIGVTGVCRRIGTTTAAVQIVKYLQMKGYQACYIEVNETDFVQEHGRFFVSDQDEVLGKVSYEGVDMFYKQENLQEIFRQGYDYFVFDYGAYSERGFNKTSFLEKDIRVFVAGSKAAEMNYTQDVLRNEYYTDVLYLFNFISEKEKPDLLEYMDEKAEMTYFTVHAPDQFEYVYNPDFDRMLPVEDIREDDSGKKRRGRGLLPWKRKKGRNAHGEV